MHNQININPNVPVLLEKEKEKNPISSIHNELNEVSKINQGKKVVSKYVEITTRTIYTFEDNSSKTITETENHTFNYGK